MEKQSIEKVEELVKKGCELVKSDDRVFSHAPLNVIQKAMPKTLELYSLTSLIAFLKDDIQGELKPDTVVDTKKGNVFLHVETPSRVVLYKKELDVHNRRESLVAADVSEYCPTFDSGRNYDQEKMTVLLQTCFHHSENRNKVIDAISKITIENESDIEDNGFSQTVSAKVGATMSRRLTLENPTYLKPRLTFSEISPIERPYILRVKHQHNEVFIALHESESRAWATGVMADIKTYLQKDLADMLIV